MPSVLGSTPNHYERLGLVEGEVSLWEDGLRTDPHAESFEWWYLDCVTDDGSKLTIEFHTKPPALSPSEPLTPFVSLTFDRTDGADLTRTFIGPPEEFEASTERCAVRIGANTFAGDLHRYDVHVDIEGVRVDLTLEGEVPAIRPATGHVFFGEAEDRYVAWLPVIPRGAVSGEIVLDGRRESLSGVGYHDHNWGNAPLRKLVDHWYWGRARIGDYTVLTLNFLSRAEHGGARHPAFMIARGAEVLATGEPDFSPEDVSEHEATGVPVAGRVRYRLVDGDADYEVSFERVADALTLDFGAAGAYHRFAGTASLVHRQGAELVASGSADALWELLYFGARRGGTERIRLDGSSGLVHQA